MSRILTSARVEQGFRSQAHLDAFYRHLDHVRSCADCRPGSAWVDDSLQGTLVECEEARQLLVASWAVS